MDTDYSEKLKNETLIFFIRRRDKQMTKNLIYKKTNSNFQLGGGNIGIQCTKKFRVK